MKFLCFPKFVLLRDMEKKCLKLIYRFVKDGKMLYLTPIAYIDSIQAQTLQFKLNQQILSFNVPG